MKKFLKYPIIYIALVLILGTGIGVYKYAVDKKTVTKPTDSQEKTQEVINPEAITKTLPSSYNLDVPYAPQAPFSNWAVHEESCEEAAILMAHEYITGNKYPNGRISDTTADKVFRDMKSWQVKNHGKELDLPMESLGKFAKDYYGLNYKVVENFTKEDVMKAISEGNLVVVPVMTHSLGNSMYGPKSVYHVLLIKGYDASGVFTNDAGVGNGPNHHYSWDVLYRAIDAQAAKMNQGRNLLVLSK